jgi:hypothetical protein
VKSVWIDPAFAKRIGKQVPADGWAKEKVQAGIKQAKRLFYETS